MSLSILLTQSTMRSRSASACRMSRSVLAMTPSTTSTTSSTPSASRSAAVTSSWKLTWPGVSIRLKRKCFSVEDCSRRLTGDALIESPRFCSSTRESVYRRSVASPPTSRFPALPWWPRRAGSNWCVSATRLSTRHVLPWCRWPRTAMLRTRCGWCIRLSMKSVLYLVSGFLGSVTSNSFCFTGATIGCVMGCVSSSWTVVSTPSP
mmetsp:Transcript_29339/g.94623  ORF Transcript_29339/g.94623 Transcript_29339/m.94623 type:complete len:206 (-) Transcript_29339:267-884(-)